MASYDFGKDHMVHWIRDHFQAGSTCLDVGACDGKWADLLQGYLTIDAVEIYGPNIDAHHLKSKYRKVFNSDIRRMRYKHYDLIIFGDVIEHMTVAEAQKVLKYAREHCDDYIIGVPFEYKQGAIYGNPWEQHIQDDLTPENFEERYPGHQMLIRPVRDYAYYHRNL